MSIAFPLPGPLAVALTGLPPDLGSVRDQLAWAKASGFRAVQLNGAAHGCRARELPRSARRDLAATLKRFELELSGIDLWIPMQHFVDAAHGERALEALLDAVALSAELANLLDAPAVVSTNLPAASAGEDVRAATEEHCLRVGAIVADHTWPPNQANSSDDRSPIRVGIDPAAIFIARGPNANLVDEIAPSSDRIGAARLTDLNEIGRVEPGTGRLDVVSYCGLLHATGKRLPLVVDTRGLAQPLQAAMSVLARFAAARLS